MINRENWKLYNEYLEYRSSVDQISNGSLGIEETHMRYLLEWLQEAPFSKAKDKRPTLPEFLQNCRLDEQEAALSETYLKKILATARRFFLWLSENKPGYSHLNNTWRNTLKVKRMTHIPHNREAVTLDDIQKIAAVPVHSISDKRIQAAAIFLYLSGMRVGAFVSMPILAVDIQKRIVKQHPNLGVRTKNGKHATTYLLNLPELLSIVQAWDQLVRSALPDHGYWFAPLSFENGDIDPKNLDCPESRRSLVNRQLKLWQREHGLQEYSPHKFRHGHVHYGMNNSRNISEYKAVSMNVMHSSMEITDSFYSVLSDNEVQNRIRNLGNQSEQTGEQEEKFRQFQKFLDWEESQRLR
jgi:integrase